MSEQQIDIKLIMAEIKDEAMRRSRQSDFERDLEFLNKSVSMNDEGEDMVDLLHQVERAKRLDLPSSVRKGFPARIFNVLLLKLYFVMKKIMSSFLITQTKLDAVIIQQLSELKKSIKFEQIDRFPYQEFERVFRQKKEEMAKTVEAVKDQIPKDISVLDIGGTNKLFGEAALEHNCNILVSTQDSDYEAWARSREKIRIDNTPLFEFLNNMRDEQFGMVVVIDLLHLYDINRVIAILHHAKRILTEGGKLLVQNYDPRDPQTYVSLFDPRLKQVIHPELMKFVLSQIGLKTIDISTKDKRKYVLLATK